MRTLQISVLFSLLTIFSSSSIAEIHTFNQRPIPSENARPEARGAEVPPRVKEDERRAANLNNFAKKELTKQLKELWMNLHESAIADVRYIEIVEDTLKKLEKPLSAKEVEDLFASASMDLLARWNWLGGNKLGSGNPYLRMSEMIVRIRKSYNLNSYSPSQRETRGTNIAKHTRRYLAQLRKELNSFSIPNDAKKKVEESISEALDAISTDEFKLRWELKEPAKEILSFLRKYTSESFQDKYRPFLPHYRN